MKNFNIEFGGFYCSIHEQLIESMLESYYSDENGDPLDYYSLDIPYSVIFNKYSKKYLCFLKEYLFDNYNLQFKPVFKQLISPREYNFSTDKINVDLNNVDANKFIGHNSIFLKSAINQTPRQKPSFLALIFKTFKLPST